MRKVVALAIVAGMLVFFASTVASLAPTTEPRIIPLREGGLGSPGITHYEGRGAAPRPNTPWSAGEPRMPVPSSSAMWPVS